MEVAMRYVLIAALILIADNNIPPIIDNGKLTCRDFLNGMAGLISWLQGYHSGKTVIPYASEAVTHYGAKIGRYCKDHPDANLIETSEHILSEIDHGI
jgi:hypothetical protein